MKTLLNILAGLFLLGLLLPVSCARSLGPEDSGMHDWEKTGTEGSRSVRIVVADALTRAGGVVYERDEQPVGRWAFFLFDHATGKLAYRGEVTGEGSATRLLRTGEYDLEVIANYPVSGQDAVDVTSIGTRAAFNELNVSLQQNALGAFVMAGTTEDLAGNRIPFTVLRTGEEEIQVADVHLKRLVSKVHVSGITRRFTNPSLGIKTLTVKGIYLTNVYTRARYASDYALGELEGSRPFWYNALGWHKEGSANVSGAVDALVGEMSLNRPLVQGETWDLDVNLYFFPNPVLPSTDVPSSEWTGRARCTRLVVWVQMDGRDYYYPATLPKEDAYAPIGRNSAFAVHCTLVAPGSTEEDEWVPGAMEVSFEPVLKEDGDWEEMALVTELS